MKSGLFTVFVASFALAGVASADIGVFAAANQDLEGARPNEASRTLYIKDRVVANERISTSAEGGGQLLFRDQSSLTIAPNSDITLDQYVYDPNSGEGDIGITVLSGAMRLVGGRITKTRPALIKTPTATIGVRGGMGSTQVMPDGSTRYMHIAGISSTIQTLTEKLVITREGGFAEVSPNGLIEFLGIAPADFVNGAYGRRAAGRGAGGAKPVEVKQKADEGVQQVEQVGSGDDDVVTSAAISTQGERQNTSETDFDVEFNDVPEDDVADNTLAQEIDNIGDDIVQEIDTFFAAGVFQPTVTSDFNNDGQATQLISQQAFVLAYSLLKDQGFAVFTLPDSDPEFEIDQASINDINQSGLGALLQGTGIDPALGLQAEGFLVSGFQNGGFDTLSAASAPGVNDVVADTSNAAIVIGRDQNSNVTNFETFAGGTVGSVDFAVDADNQLVGSFFLDYSDNPDFQQIESIDGPVDINGVGIANAAAGIDAATDSLRTLIETERVEDESNF